MLALANDGVGSDADWIAAVATVVARKAPAEWTDDDHLRFDRELPERLAAFHRLVALHAERRVDGGGPFDALRVTVTRSDGSEYIRMVGIDGKEADQTWRSALDESPRRSWCRLPAQPSAGGAEPPGPAGRAAAARLPRTGAPDEVAPVAETHEHLAVAAGAGACAPDEVAVAETRKEGGRWVRHCLSRRPRCATSAAFPAARTPARLAVYMRDRVPEMEYFFCDTGAELPETYEYLTRLEVILGQADRRG